MKISKRTIEQICKTDKDQFFWDDSLKGFGVKVYKSGRISFVVQGRLDGDVKRYTIGAFGSPWTAETARQQALQYLAMMARGEDPVAKKRAKRRELRLNAVATRYLADGNLLKKTSTRELEERLISRHILPLLGKKKISSISKGDVKRFINDVATGKTAADIKTKPRGRARITGGKGTANRSVAVLSAIFAYAIENELCTDNPTQGMPLYKLKTHDRYLNNDELLRLGDALNSAEMKGVSPYAVAAIRFMMLSGCRSGEALSLRHSWIDFDNKLVKLPDSKTGQRIMLLGEGAVQLLSMMEPLDGSPLVFPSSAGDETQISIQKIWRAIREEADLEDVRLHDLRHNFASTAVSSGESLYIVAKLLGHSQVRTTQRYAHLAPDPVKSAADSVSNRLAEIMGGERSD